MELQRFLSLLAACIGFVGAIFLAKGVLSLSPKAMLDLTPPHSRIDYAPEQIASLATQKANTLIGVIYIGGAFVIQVISLMFSNYGKLVTETRWTGFWIILAIISLVAIIFSITNVKIRDWYRIEMGKIEVRQHCIDTFSRVRVDPVNVKGIEHMSFELLGLKKRDSESIEGFINRVAEYIGWTIPKNIDFSEFGE